MTQYLVAIHHPDDFDPSTETEATVREIDALNQEMAAAGVSGFRWRPHLRSRGEISAGATRWQGAHHRRAVPGDQGAHRRFLGAGSCKSGGCTCVGTQGCQGLSGAGRSAPVWDTTRVGN